MFSSRRQSNNKPINLVTRKSDPSGFSKRYIDKNIGFGVFTTKCFQKGTPLLHYKGVSCSEKEGKRRLENYESRGMGSYIFFYKSDEKRKCIDATLDNSLARFVNDAPDENANCKMKRVWFKNADFLYLVATRDVHKNEELRYDYNEDGLIWRQNDEYLHPFYFDESKMVCSNHKNVYEDGNKENQGSCFGGKSKQEDGVFSLSGGKRRKERNNLEKLKQIKTFEPVTLQRLYLLKYLIIVLFFLFKNSTSINGNDGESKILGTAAKKLWECYNTTFSIFRHKNLDSVEEVHV